MSTLTFADTHNMVAFLEKPVESDGFHEIIDFLNTNQIRYALTVNPTIYTSCIQQFWVTAKANTVNGEHQIQALIDNKKIIITELSIRSDLQLGNAGGTDCLPTATIFEELAHIGYEEPSQKLTFYKSFFSPQWKFLIHTITQSLSAKTIAWNEFSSAMASAIICLATNQKFNFSKYIFDAMRRKGFSGRVAPLFATMMVQPNQEEGVDSGIPTDSHQTPITTQPSTSRSQKQSRRKQRKDTAVTQEEPQQDDSVLDLEKAKDAQAKEIADLKKRVQKLERKKKSRTTWLKRLRKVGMSRRVKSSEDKDSLGDHEDASKQGRSIEDIDKDADVSLVDDTQERSDDAEIFDINELHGDEIVVDIPVAKPKVVTNAATTTTTTRPKARGVIVQEPSEFRTPQESQPSMIKDKGKAIMIEPEVPLKRKDQVALDEDLTRNLQAQLEAELIEEERLAKKKEEEANIALIESWDNTQAMMETDFAYLKNMAKKETRESSKGIEDELKSNKSKKAESSEEKAKGSKKKMLVIIIAQQQHQLMFHMPDEPLCPPNKENNELWYANKKVDLEHVQCPLRKAKSDEYHQESSHYYYSICAASSIRTMDRFLWEGALLFAVIISTSSDSISKIYKDHYVPLTQSQPTESTQGTHRTTSAPRSPNPNKEATESSAPRRSTVIRLRIPERRSTRLTLSAPVPNVDKADEMILQDTLQVSLAEHKSRKEQEARENVALVDEHLASEEIEKMVEGQANVVDDSSIPRNDESNIPDTRIEPRSNKESSEVEITKDKEVEITKETLVVDITNVVIPVNVNDENEKITDEVYELKRREKGKIIEETRNSPILTPIRSPRIHINLTKPTRFKRYKNFFYELQGRYGYLFAHLRARFMPGKSFDTLADNLHDVMVETLPTMVDKHIKEQVMKQVPEQVRNQVPVYVAKGLILKRQKAKEETERLIAKAIMQEHGNIQAQISTQIENAIANVIPSQVDASVRSYMSGHILHVHPAQSQTSSVPDQQYQLYLAMKADPQLQQQDIAIWLALQMKFERNTVPQTACRTPAVRPRDQDDPHDDAHPEGENSAKRQKTSEYEAYVSRESSSGQVFQEEQAPSTLDDDEIPTKQVSQDIMEEVSLTIDKAKPEKDG
ncbi:hypothetical protein Tco_1320116 [Tanacetum coccineum]